MQFEARKVVSNLRAPGFSPSAADVLGEPVVVCRAIGHVRRAQGSAAPPEELYLPGLPPGPAPGTEPIVTDWHEPDLVLTAAIVGAEITRAQTPHLPITAREIADEAARCREAGAAVIHLHVRNDDGSPTQSAERFAEAIAAIRAKTDCIVQTSTGGAVGMSLDERAQPLQCKPEMATLNCGTINFGDDVFVNSRTDIRDLAARIAKAGSIAELECYEVGHVEEALKLLAEGAISSAAALPIRARRAGRHRRTRRARALHALARAERRDVGGRGRRSLSAAAHRSWRCGSADTRAWGSRTTSTSRRASSRRGARRS